MALTKITSDVIASGAIESTHIASGAISSSHLTGITTDNVSEGSTNTYFTNARARGSVSVTGGHLSYDSGTGVIQLTNAAIEGAISTLGDISTGNITTTGYLRGPATFTIDPSAHGNNTGTLVVAGNLQVDGTTTTINSTTMTVDDLNITLASGAANAAAANGAGITVDGASATITYDGTNDEWDFNKDINVSSRVLVGEVKASANQTFTHGTGSTVNFRNNSAASRLFIDSSGNVGIGSSSPDTLLELFADNPVLRLRDSKVKGSSWAAGDALGGLEFYTSDTTGIGTHTAASITAVNGGQDTSTPDAEIVFSTAPYNTVASEKVRIDSSGNLLVGTTNTLPANNNVEGIALSAGSYGGRLEASRSGGAPCSFNRVDSDGSIIELRKAGTTVGNIGAVGGDVAIYSTGSSHAGLRFAINAYLPTNNAGAVVDATTDFGTGAYRYKDLYLSGSAFIDTQTRLGNGSAATPSYSFSADSDSGMFRATTNTLGFSTAATERMRIDSSGKVGIGTDSPNRPLEIKASSAAMRLQQTGGAYAEITSSDFGILYLNADAGNTASSTSMRFLVDNSEAMRLDSSGRLLIGGTSATFGVLGVESSGNCNVDFFSNSGSSTAAKTELFFSGGISGNSHVSLASIVAQQASGDEATRKGELRFLTANSGGPSTKMIIAANGDVGITAAASLRFNGTGDNTHAVGYDSTVDGSFIRGQSGIRVLTGTGSGTERMRIESGNLLVGTTSTTVGGGGSGVKGFRVDGANGIVQAAASSNTPAILNRTTSDGNIVSFRKNGTDIGTIGVTNGSQLYIGSNDTALWFSNGFNQIIPYNTTTGAGRDNAIDLGRSSIRFDDIYATNGTIQTSDRNEKQDIAELTDAETRVAVAAKGLLRKFRWKDAVAEKGDEARTHFGIIAQDLQDAFTAEGLDAGDYAMFISDTWTDDDGVEQTRLGVRYSELLAFIIAAI